MYTPLFFITTVLSLSLRAVGQTAYANDFVDPDYIIAGDFPTNTGRAQVTVTKWAASLAGQGPWSVMDKQAAPPTGDKHDYLSWAPYWWPDCSRVGNTTALTDQQIWTTCPYVRRDGQFNPDVRTVNDVGNFQDMSEAVFYNALAWAFSKTPSNQYSKNAVLFLRTWYLDSATRMNPNLNYAQVQRGPGEQIGSDTGVLDLKGTAKVASAVLILRKGNSTDWTSDLDAAMIAWCKQYIQWLETDTLALEESSATNNHGTFYYNQLAALKLIVNDNGGAATATGKYFSTQFLSQISANGEQPLEASRTRPYHYRAYNLAGIITNARLDKYANPSSTVWNRTASSGAGIKAALDYAMGISATASGEASYAAELYPDIAAVASVYGDPQGTYVSFLKAAQSDFASQPYFFWNQPFAPNEGGPLPTTATKTTSPVKATSTTKSGTASDDNTTSSATSLGVNLWLSVAMVAAFILLG